MEDRHLGSFATGGYIPGPPIPWWTPGFRSPWPLQADEHVMTYDRLDRKWTTVAAWEHTVLVLLAGGRDE